MSDLHYYYLFVIVYCITILLSITSNLLNSLNRGSIRALEEFDSKSSERLEEWFFHAEELRIPLRLLFLINLGILLITTSKLFKNHLENPIYLIVIAGLMLIHFALTEFFGYRLALKTTVTFFNTAVPILKITKWLFFPITLPLIFLCRRASEWKETNTTKEEIITAEDEILSLVDHEDEATNKTLDEDERRMIRNIFDLDETIVKEIMTPRVDLVAVEEKTNFLEILEIVKNKGLSNIPLYKERIDNIVGVLNVKDLLTISQEFNDTSLSTIARTPWFIPENKNIGDLLQEIIGHGRHTAIVLDEYGGLAGIVTIKDILEEIVGEIHDNALYEDLNSQEPEEEVKRNDDGSFDIDARINLADLNEELALKLEADPSITTLAGFILNLAGRIPHKDELITIENQEFLVLEAEPQRIIKVRLLSKKKKELEKE